MTSRQSLLSSADIDFFHANGFVHVKGVFNAAECERLRTADLLDGAWDDPRMVEIARTLLGETPVFSFVTSIDRRDNEKENEFKARKIHHDARGTPKHIFARLHAPCDYPVIRCGIYFQDYSRGDRSGAIKVSPGSHKIDTSAFDEDSLPYYNVPAAPGDVIVFMRRLLHSGHSLSLRSDPKVAYSPARENSELLRDPDQFLPLPPLREALFIDYSDHSELADLNIKSAAVDPGVTCVGLASRVTSEILSRGHAAGLDLRIDMALVECCDAVLSRRKANGRVGQEAAPAIQEFLSLLPFATDFSPHFSLWRGLRGGPEGCLEAIDRIREYRSSMELAGADPHMVPRVPRSAPPPARAPQPDVD